MNNVASTPEQDAIAAAAARDEFGNDVNRLADSVSSTVKQMLNDGAPAPALALSLALVLADVAAALIVENGGSVEQMDGLIANIGRDVVERSRYSFEHYSQAMAARANSQHDLAKQP